LPAVARRVFFANCFIPFIYFYFDGCCSIFLPLLLLIE
jgi:hypothetical protein